MLRAGANLELVGTVLGTARRARPPSTRRSMSRCSRRSHNLGRETRHAEQPCRALCCFASQAWAPIRRTDAILERYARYAEAHGIVYTSHQSDPRLVRVRVFTESLQEHGMIPFDGFAFFSTLRTHCMRSRLANVSGEANVQRPAPYILEPDQIRAIMRHCARFAAQGCGQPAYLSCLFGLLAATGLRISEALALQRHDMTDDGLVIRHGKFGKRRLVPLHATTRRALKDYVAIRDKLGGDGDDLFVVKSGRPPTSPQSSSFFVRLARRARVSWTAGT